MKLKYHFSQSRMILGNQQGFTLVEIMTAAAIVAVLAAIAIPNYLSYTASGRQAEAKIALSNIYSAEMNFGAEAGFYSACLTQLGYVPAAGDTRYYSVGFSNAASVATKCGPTGNKACNIYVPPAASNCTATALVGQDALTATQIAYASNARGSSGYNWPKDSDLVATIAGGPGIGSTAFSAGAAGNISSSATRMDNWYIDNTKKMVQSQSGI